MFLILDFLFSDHVKSDLLGHSPKLVTCKDHFQALQLSPALMILLQKCFKAAASLIIHLSIMLNFNISNLAFVIEIGPKNGQKDHLLY